MKTLIYVNNNTYFKKNKIADLIIGIILIIISFSGLFLESKFMLKIIAYIMPLILFIYALNTYKLALSIKKTDKKHFLLFLIHAIILTLGALYMIIFPIKSLNYIIIFLGIILITNSILTNPSKPSFKTFLLGILLAIFSNQIINTLYSFILIIMFIFGISKLFNFFYKLK